jgi:hypothetical protein
LKTLALLLDAGLPSERPRPAELTPLPNGLTADGAEYKVWVQKHDEEMAACNRALLIGELVDYRTSLRDIIRDTYALKPVATDELRQLATNILKNDKVVGDLVTALEKVLREQAYELAQATPPPPPGVPAGGPPPAK